MGQKRNVTIRIRLTELEHEQILQEVRERGISTLSAYARQCMLAPVHDANDHYKKELHRLAFDLRKAGNNLSQLKRNLERGMKGQEYLLQLEALQKLEHTIDDTRTLLGQIKESEEEE